MKVKFLVPEIDRNRFSESLKYRMDWFKKSSKDLTNIGSESYTEQNIYKYKKIAYFLKIFLIEKIKLKLRSKASEV